MTEQAPSFEPEVPTTEHGSQLTGVAAVDQVLADVDALDELPLDRHVAAFERAHESLRGALDAELDAEPDAEPGAEPDTQPDTPA